MLVYHWADAEDAFGQRMQNLLVRRRPAATCWNVASVYQISANEWEACVDPNEGNPVSRRRQFPTEEAAKRWAEAEML